MHRKITQWEWYTDANTMRVFLHLILLANHKETRWRGEIIQRGQVLTGLDQLARELKLSKMKIRVAIEHLISTGEITNKSTNKYRIVTINNYASYQDKKERKQQAKQQAVEHSNNIQITASNNDNNDNKKTISYEIEGAKQKNHSFVPPTIEEAVFFFCSNGWQESEAKLFWHHFNSNGWKVGGKAPMKSWESAAHKWIGNGNKFNDNSNGKQQQRRNGRLEHQRPLSPEDMPDLMQSIADDPRYS